MISRRAAGVHENLLRLPKVARGRGDDGLVVDENLSARFQSRPHVVLAEFFRVAFVEEQDVAFDPVAVRLLGTDGIVAEAADVADAAAGVKSVTPSSPPRRQGP